MKKRLLLKLGLVALLGVIGVWAYLHVFASPLPRIDEKQVKMIQVGMTLDEVEQLLGCKPGNYAHANLLPINMWAYSDEQRNNPAPYKEWAADTSEEPYENANGPNRHSGLAVRVWFDENGRVLDKCRMGYEYTPPTWFTRVKRAVGLETTKRR